ncbi:uncharacterized protein BDV14DRAFT_99992 [Aspergillus stella-maris]|uniref:uncharacterized protein n=1 Tax=Aspergillus stella-maris TaxID=1810926 RepID=UPI003CCCD775
MRDGGRGKEVHGRGSTTRAARMTVGTLGEKKLTPCLTRLMMGSTRREPSGSPLRPVCGQRAGASGPLGAWRRCCAATRESASLLLMPAFQSG